MNSVNKILVNPIDYPVASLHCSGQLASVFTVLFYQAYRICKLDQRPIFPVAVGTNRLSPKEGMGFL